MRRGGIAAAALALVLFLSACASERSPEPTSAGPAESGSQAGVQGGGLDKANPLAGETRVWAAPGPGRAAAAAGEGYFPLKL